MDIDRDASVIGTGAMVVEGRSRRFIDEAIIRILSHLKSAAQGRAAAA